MCIPFAKIWRENNSPIKPLKRCFKIIADIYGCQYRGVREYGWADSTDKEDLGARLRSLEERWELLCPGFYKWFNENRKPIFEGSVIERVTKPTNVHGLYYKNTIEAQHFRQKNRAVFQTRHHQWNSWNSEDLNWKTAEWRCKSTIWIQAISFESEL